MANNLIVSYDLIAPGQHYDRVTEAVKSLGNWAKIEYSLFYVNSTLSASAAAQQVWAAMTPNDKLMVVDSTNNHFGCFNIAQDVLAYMQQEWYR